MEDPMNRTKSSNLIFGLTALALSWTLLGCPKKAAPVAEEVTPEAAANAEAAPGDDAAAGSTVVEVGTDWTAVGALATAYFDFNRADLPVEAREVLKKNALVIKALVKQAPGVKVRVEGYCDERGTLEYNLALGQRRANALRDYYQSLGVAKSALSTISYGEEKPVCGEADEACWSRNRRGETSLRSTSGPLRLPVQP
jgi:peptidoglycan-associated lipoprotein